MSDLIMPAAHAADAVTPAVNAAFMYAFAATDGDLPHTAKTHLDTYSPAKTLLPTEGGLTRKIIDRIQGKSQITCGAEAATGRMIISKQPVDFAVKKDGSVVITPFDSKQTVKVSSSVTPLFGAAAVYQRGLSYETCLDSNCSKTTGHARSSIKSFLRNVPDEFVDQAVTFRPREPSQPPFPIEFACEDASDCNEMVINGLDRLNKSDAKWAVKYRDEANASLRKTRSEQNELVLSVRPLYACCQDKACRAAVLEQGIQLKPASGPANSTTTAP